MAVPLSFLRRTRQSRLSQMFRQNRSTNESTVGDMENFIKSTYGTMTQGKTLQEARSIRQAAPPVKKFKAGAGPNYTKGKYPRPFSMLTPKMKGQAKPMVDPYDDTVPRELLPDALQKTFPDAFGNILPPPPGLNQPPRIQPPKIKKPKAPTQNGRNLLNPYDGSRRFGSA